MRNVTFAISTPKLVSPLLGQQGTVYDVPLLVEQIQVVDPRGNIVSTEHILAAQAVGWKLLPRRGRSYHYTQPFSDARWCSRLLIRVCEGYHGRRQSGVLIDRLP